MDKSKNKNSAMLDHLKKIKVRLREAKPRHRATSVFLPKDILFLNISLTKIFWTRPNFLF